MAIKGLSIAENEDFYSASEDESTPTNEKTKWVLGAIDLITRSTIQDNTISWIQTDAGMQMVNRTTYRDFEICRFGIKGFENFKNPKTGDDIIYKTVDRAMNGKAYKNVSDDILNAIPGHIISEIALRLIEINTATDALRKK